MGKLGAAQSMPKSHIVLQIFLFRAFLDRRDISPHFLDRWNISMISFLGWASSDANERGNRRIISGDISSPQEPQCPIYRSFPKCQQKCLFDSWDPCLFDIVCSNRKKAPLSSFDLIWSVWRHWIDANGWKCVESYLNCGSQQENGTRKISLSCDLVWSVWDANRLRIWGRMPISDNHRGPSFISAG